MKGGEHIEFIYSTKGINLISLVISIVIFLIVNFFINNFNNTQNFFQSNIDSEFIIKDQNQSNEEEPINIDEKNWYIEIDSINLIAPIKDGVDDETLAKYVGHFKETSLNVGNVGLAAHNRGYEENYFENLKDVKKGDEIKYIYENISKIYVVDTIEVIRNTDWSYLENTDENKITLITCVENEPKFRRCVQATEKEM